MAHHLLSEPPSSQTNACGAILFFYKRSAAEHMTRAFQSAGAACDHDEPKVELANVASHTILTIVCGDRADRPDLL